MTEITACSRTTALKMMGSDVKVCVYSCDKQEIRGKIYHCSLKEPMDFRGISDMLLKVENIYDDIGFPLATPARRSINPGESTVQPLRYYHDFKDFASMEGEKFAFFLKVRYRQNVSWQGSIHFSGDVSSYQFRSVLELMGYIMEKIEDYRT